MSEIPIVFDPPSDEVRNHLRAFIGFERLLWFSVLHVALLLACLALAFIGHIPLLAFLFFIAGSLITITGFVVRGAPPTL